MGFKRTTDGRVFFQGAQGSANDASGQAQQPAQEQPLTSPQGGGQSQLQILTLLKSLNDRLKTTQAERNYMRKQLEAYREVIEGLEDKAERNERAFKTLEENLSANPAAAAPQMQRTEELMKETLREMAETRKLILDVEDKAERADRNVSSLQKMQQEQAQRMAKSTAGYAQVIKRLKESESRQEDLGARLEETASEQSKLSRKVDKAVEDRARFMRKIERIEETVIQTRDALNAKAMVLLTDQGASPAENLLEEEQTLGEMLLQNNQVPQAEKIMHVDAATNSVEAEKNKPMRVQGLFIIFLLVAAGAMGWLVSQMDFSGRTTGAPETVYNAPINDSSPSTTNERAEPPQDWRIERNTEAFSEAPAPVVAPRSESAAVQAVNALDDIGAIDVQDEQQILDMLEGNPDAVASALNNIEPGTTQPESVEQASLEPQEEATAAPIAVTPEQVPAPEEAAAPYTPTAVAGAFQPDPNLPPVIKQVEEQAYAGSAEAQHDLAAIYTAGHGGVAQDYNRAAYWFRKAADQGVANARYNLGVLFHQGLGVRPNMPEAIYWYDQAAALGHPEAQYNLGIAYIEGIGVPYTPAKAAAYFEQAANGGVMEAAYNLGLIYENALLGQAKPDVALMWYKVAADQGSPEAKTALEQLAKALDIKLEDVNRLVEGMRESGGSNGAARAPVKSSPAEPVKTEDQRSEAPVQSDLAPQQSANAAPEVTAQETALNNREAAEQEFEQILIAQVQEQLMRDGLYPGPADGRAGMLTSDAIRSYQKQAGLPVNGIASNELLSYMLAQNGSGQLEQGSRAQ